MMSLQCRCHKTFSVSSSYGEQCHHSTGVRKPLQFPHPMNRDVDWCHYCTAQVSNIGWCQSQITFVVSSPYEWWCHYSTGEQHQLMSESENHYRFLTLWMMVSLQHMWATSADVRVRKPLQVPHLMNDDVTTLTSADVTTAQVSNISWCQSQKTFAVSTQHEWWNISTSKQHQLMSETGSHYSFPTSPAMMSLLHKEW